MPKISKGFFRSLSVFYLLLLTASAFFALYYLKIMPGNVNELNVRAQRALKQVSGNIADKNTAISQLFKAPPEKSHPHHLADNSWYFNLQHKKQNFEYLSGLTYEYTLLQADPRHYFSGEDTSFLKSTGNQSFWIYRGMTDGLIGDTECFQISIPLDRFIEDILESRKDVFSTYLLLEEENSAGQKTKASILYAQDPITNARQLSLDTLAGLQRNSDGSATASLTVSGMPYKVFFHPFTLNNQHLMLCGLLETPEYNKRISQTPVDFIPITVISILLLLIAMPFLKLYLLSPQERITRTDVALTGISFYLGPVIGCLIIFYCLLHVVNGLTYDVRLASLSSKLQESVERDINASLERLKKYDSIPFTISQQQFLHQPVEDNEGMDSVDRVMSRWTGKHTARIFWNDSAGNTLAKWNTFESIVPNTSVTNLPFFLRFSERKTPLRGKDNHFYSVYAGKSNATNEFQVYVSIPSKKVFVADLTGSGIPSDSMQAFSISEAMSIEISDHIVLPLGFCFSLVDENGNVLADCDPERNLLENILEEADHNGVLEDALRKRPPGTTFPVELHGTNYTATVRPILDQNLFLVVMYDESLSKNIFRLLLFSIQSLLWLAIAVVVSVLLSTVSRISPSRIRFRISVLEWIRPANSNKLCYDFTSAYFLRLCIMTVLFFLAVILLNGQLDCIFYVSTLLPFLGIWAFVAARNSSHRSSDTPVTQSALFRNGRVPLAFVTAIVLLMLFFWYRSNSSLSSLVGFVLFTLTAILLMFFQFKSVYVARKEKGIVFNKMTQYQSALTLSVILISTLPSVGIITYAYQSEKLQHKKEKMLLYAARIAAQQDYLYNDLTLGYKQVVADQLGGQQFMREKFVTDGDRLDSVDRADFDSLSAHLPDNLYNFLVNRAAIAGKSVNSFLPAGSTALDRSWQFKWKHPSVASAPQLVLRQAGANTNSDLQPIFASSVFRNAIADFFSLPPSFWLACIICVVVFIKLSKRIVITSVRRLFLNNIIATGQVRIDHDFVLSRLNAVPPHAPLLDHIKLEIPLTQGFSDREADALSKLWIDDREDYILSMAASYGDAYENIWQSLDRHERYILFDFSTDYYTNYRNIDVFMSLIGKGVLVNRDGAWVLFSLGFRQYILGKKGNDEIEALNKEFSKEGKWETFRIAALSLVAVTSFAIVYTQTELTQKMLALFTSVTAFFPLVTKMFSWIPSKDKPAA